MGKFALKLMRAAALALMFAGFIGVAAAQQPTNTQVQLAREVVQASGATRAFEGVVPGILQQAIAVFVQQNPDLQKQLVESAQAILPEFDKRREEILDIVARVYASRFTDAELKELLTFYNSAVGKKFVAALPAVLEESFRRTQEWAGKVSEEAISRMRAEMKKRGHNI